MLSTETETLNLNLTKWVRRSPKMTDKREDETRNKAMARDRRLRLEELRIEDDEIDE
jgi:hypothetical protein